MYLKYTNSLSLFSSCLCVLPHLRSNSSLLLFLLELPWPCSLPMSTISLPALFWRLFSVFLSCSLLSCLLLIPALQMLGPLPPNPTLVLLASFVSFSFSVHLSLYFYLTHFQFLFGKNKNIGAKRDFMMGYYRKKILPLKLKQKL